MISVIMPTFNCATYLDECLESVFRQTRTDLEVLVVDDGSTDNTTDVLRKWAPQIRMVKQENAGVAAARNTGIRESSGEYVAFLDADDLWKPDKLALQMQALERSPSAGLVCSDFSIVDRQGTTTPSHFARGSGYQNGRVFSRLVRECFVFVSTVLVRRSVLQITDGFDTTTICDDYNMWLKIAHHADISVVPQVLVTKRERPEIVRNGEYMLGQQLIALRNLNRQLPDLSEEERRAVDTQIARLELALGTSLLINNRGSEARRHLAHAPWTPSNAALMALTFMPASAVQAARRVRRRLRQAPR